MKKYYLVSYLYTVNNRQWSHGNLYVAVGGGRELSIPKIKKHVADMYRLSSPTNCTVISYQRMTKKQHEELKGIA